ncbi:hypothetical protein C0J50_3446 [Silurus asotus]|uniref:Uncharacterized protein n=1 Tax=Silurus asotus TaxID=30991 RepID=A0AAD5AFQ5_SILAS|nr:hypothetical protein C0J50_3446 [Silurus asotus]
MAAVRRISSVALRRNRLRFGLEGFGGEGGSRPKPPHALQRPDYRRIPGPRTSHLRTLPFGGWWDLKGTVPLRLRHGCRPGRTVLSPPPDHGTPPWAVTAPQNGRLGSAAMPATQQPCLETWTKTGRETVNSLGERRGNDSLRTGGVARRCGVTTPMETQSGTMPSAETGGRETNPLETWNGATPSAETGRGLRPSAETWSWETATAETGGEVLHSAETAGGAMTPTKTRSGATPLTETEGGVLPLKETWHGATPSAATGDWTTTSAEPGGVSMLPANDQNQAAPLVESRGRVPSTAESRGRDTPSTETGSGATPKAETGKGATPPGVERQPW